MISRVNLRPFHSSSDSSSSSLSSTSISSDSCFSSSGSISSCCTHLTHSSDQMALQHRHIWQNSQGNLRNLCNACTSHTLECLYASLSIDSKRREGNNNKCTNNNCRCTSHQNNVYTTMSPHNTCHCFNRTMQCETVNNFEIVNDAKDKIPVKGDAKKRITPSSVSRTSSREYLTESPFVTSQVSGGQNKLNILPKATVALSPTVAQAQAKSDTCQVNQLINENKQLRCIRESQALELKAQRLTLQEQRSHIAILEQALMITESSVEQLKARLASTPK